MSTTNGTSDPTSSAGLADGNDICHKQTRDGNKQHADEQEDTPITTNTTNSDKISANIADGDETSSLKRSYEILNDSSTNNNNNKGWQVPKTSMDCPPINETHNLNKSNEVASASSSAIDGVEGAEEHAKPKNQPSAKKSGSFLSKLTSSTSSYDNRELPTDGQNSITNLPSNFANMISSMSFTSGFRRGSNAGVTGAVNSNSLESGANNSFEQNASKLTIETASISTGVSVISETREQILFKKAFIERKNLINLTKLIVKDLISSSLTVGRTIDDHHQCAIHLNNYFTLLDRVLKHGLKQNILSSRSAGLWNALDNLPRYLTDKRLTSETVRSLAHTKTPDGRIKAWLRIAMMQKKLPEYFNELLANKNVLLKDIYHDFAFMINDEAQVFAGLIIGVNVIDCNFFVKDDNFDMMDEVIDLSPYLRAANTFDEDDQLQEKRILTADNSQLENISAVLDQKNYLEERSLHLQTTVEGLHEKIRHLEEQNSRLEMDAKVNEIRIQKLQGGQLPKGQDRSAGNDRPLLAGFPLPDALKNLMNPSMDSKQVVESPDEINKQNLLESGVYPAPSAPSSQATETLSVAAAAPTDKLTSSLAENVPDNKLALNPSETQVSSSGSTNNGSAIDQQLVADLEQTKKLAADRERELSGLRERVGILETSYRSALERIKALERDAEVQTTINGDKEATIKIYERDLRDKQNQVESLKSSLSEAKKLNTELNERLNDTGSKLKDRLNTVTSLQASLDKWKLENKNLATRYQDKLTALKSLSNQLDQSLKTIEELKKYNEKINDDLRKERECGQSCSETVDEQTTKISELTSRLNHLEIELKESKPYKEQMIEFKKRCQDYEQSLEEVGYQLRESRLEVESLKENSSVFLDSQWMDSKQVKSCALCQQTFSVTRRKHHCRLCGNVFCQTCSDNKMELASSSKPARVCDTCHAFLLAKFVKSSSATASNVSTSSASIT